MESFYFHPHNLGFHLSVLLNFNLNLYKGNVLLVVNIASQCGLTKSNYAKLTELNKKYYDSGNGIQ